MSVYSDLPLFGGYVAPADECASCSGWPLTRWCDDCAKWAKAMAGQFTVRLGAASPPATLGDAAVKAAELGLDRQCGSLWFMAREARL